MVGLWPTNYGFYLFELIDEWIPPPFFHEN
jgi:hypothetical protein